MKRLFKKTIYIIPVIVLVFLIFPGFSEATVSIYSPSYYDRQEISTECGTYDYATQTGKRELYCQNNLCGSGSQVTSCSCVTHTCCAEYKSEKVVRNNWFDSYKTVLHNITCVPKTDIVPQATTEEKTGTEIPIKLNVPLPGFDETEVTGTTFGNYLNTFYRYFTGIVGILAATMIVYAGIQYIVAAGNKTAIERAKATMSGAFIGLVLTLAAYLILYTINPSLVEWGSLELPAQEKVPLVEEYDECGTESSLSELKDYFNDNDFLVIDKNVSDPRVNSGIIEMISRAATKLKQQDLTMVIKSAHRSIKIQEWLYKCYKNYQDTGECHPTDCSDGCNPAAKPKCEAPHVTGLAIDVCVYAGDDKTLCSMMQPAYNNAAPPGGDRQLVLQQIMQEVGFSRYCGEWWHFEGIQMSTSCAPGEYK